MNDLRMSTSLYRENTDYGFKNNINKFVTYCFNESKDAGWHDKPTEAGTMLMLIVCEICQAMQGHRKNLMDEHLPHRKMMEVELADAMIRIGDLAAEFNLDLGAAIDEKLQYNKNRPDHKIENRALDGGKKY